MGIVREDGERLEGLAQTHVVDDERAATLAEDELDALALKGEERGGEARGARGYRGERAVGASRGPREGAGRGSDAPSSTLDRFLLEEEATEAPTLARFRADACARILFTSHAGLPPAMAPEAKRTARQTGVRRR